MFFFNFILTSFLRLKISIFKESKKYVRGAHTKN